MQNIANKVVIITGASSGIGEATALKLAREGAKIVLGARREDKLKSIADQIKASGGEAVYRVTDVTKPEDNAALVALAKEAFGKVDVIFLNAGLMPSSPLSALETANWNAMIDVNIKGVLNGIAAVLPTMKAQKSGQIINVSSVAGHVWGPMCAVYSASKTAVRAISEALRKEVKPYNIRSTILSPGAVASELKHGSSSETAKGAMENFYAANEIPAASFARCVLFAISQPEEVDVNEIIFRPTRQEV